MKKAVYLLLIMITILLSTGCGGGGGSDVSDENYGWVTITSHDGPIYTTFNMEILLFGSAYINGALDDMFNFDTGVQVYWKNLTSGIGGNAKQYSDYGCAWFICTWDYHRWQVVIPLVMGENQIEVTASDVNGNWGEETITVIHPLTHVPGIFAVSAEYVSPGNLSFEAEVDTGDLPSEIRFEFGEDYSLPTFRTTMIEPILASHDSQLMQVPFYGVFDPNTKYYYRAVATNSSGTGISATYSFITGDFQPFPSVSTEAPDPVGANKATLHGNVELHGASADVWFEWGTDPYLTSYDTTPVETLNTASSPQSFSFTISDLSQGTSYYFRAVASNSTGNSKGGILSLRVTDIVGTPYVETGPVLYQGAYVTILQGTVNTNGWDTDAWFEWTLDPAFLTFNVGPIEALSDQTIGQTYQLLVTNLDPLTTYRYRAVAENFDGITEGAPLNITTTTVADWSQWAITLGGVEDDRAAHIKRSPEGGFFVVGDTSSFGSHSLWILKFDTDHNVLWQKTYPSFKGAVSMSVTPDGGCALIGTDASGTWAMKVDKEGVVQWAKIYEDGYAGGNSIDQTLDGGYIIAGFTWSQEGNGKNEYWVLKLTSGGDIQWQKSFGNPDYNVAESVRQTNDGGYIVTGYTQNRFSGNRDIRILKLNSSGNIQWWRTYKSYAQRAFTQPTSDGGYVVLGIPGYQTTPSFEVYRLDSEGLLLWVKRYYYAYAIPKNDAIQETSDNGFIVSGNGQEGDIVLVKINTDGTVAWQKRYGGSAYNSASSVSAVENDSDGGYLLAATTASFGKGNADVWILKTKADGSITPLSTETRYYTSDVTPETDVFGLGGNATFASVIDITGNIFPRETAAAVMRQAP
ncbi:MAG: hypothetical protein ACC669_06905 [bacterium]